MSRKYFGTDGIRGRVGEMPITPEFIMKLGFAAGQVLAAPENRPGSERPAVLIGKDTRISGYMLEAALEAGFSAAGVDVCLIGPMPTPGVAYLTRALRLQAGVVISASHNPFDDNGIKFFSANGAKLPDAVEHAIEEALDIALEQGITSMPSAKLGKARRITDAGGCYIEFCKSTVPSDFNLRGVRLVIDCAHGATYHTAPHVFHELGADVFTIGVSPDGMNINSHVGATSPEFMIETVKTRGADFGIALDGDGDRLIMCDRDGQVFDGDQLLYVIAQHMAKEGKLGGVAGTLMTNLGLEHAFKKMGLAFDRAKVGDRHVLEMLLENKWILGGENSGHIICLDRHTTGDGIISALQVLAAAITDGKVTAIADLTADLTLYPQILINVPIEKGFDWAGNISIVTATEAAEKALADTGRVLLRPSGTEPLLRVMVEGSDAALVQAQAETIAEAVRQAAT